MSVAYCESCGARGELSFEDLMEGSASCEVCGGVLVLMAGDPEGEPEGLEDFDPPPASGPLARAGIGVPASGASSREQVPGSGSLRRPPTSGLLRGVPASAPPLEDHESSLAALAETHPPIEGEAAGDLPPLPSWDGSDTREVPHRGAYDELQAAAQALLATGAEPVGELETIELKPGESSSGRASRAYDADAMDQTTRDWEVGEGHETQEWQSERPAALPEGEATRSWAVVPDPAEAFTPPARSALPEPPQSGLFSFDRDPDWEALLDEELQELEEDDPSARRVVLRVPESAADHAHQATGIDDLLRPYGISSPETGVVRRDEPTTQRWKIEPRTQTLHVFARSADPRPQQRVPSVNFRDIDPAVTFARFPSSPRAGRYSTLATRLGAGKTIVVTSAARREGRTSVALNLALAAARSPNQSAILVEADLDGGSAPGMLGVPNTDKGLLTLLQDQTDPRGALIRFDLGEFQMLPRGRGGDRARVGDRIGDLLVELREHYPKALIVVDAAPVREGSSRLLGKGTDGALIVVRRGRSTREEVAEAVATLGRGRVLGALFNEG